MRIWKSVRFCCALDVDRNLNRARLNRDPFFGGMTNSWACLSWAHSTSWIKLRPWRIHNNKRNSLRHRTNSCGSSVRDLGFELMADETEANSKEFSVSSASTERSRTYSVYTHQSQWTKRSQNSLMDGTRCVCVCVCIALSRVQSTY